MALSTVKFKIYLLGESGNLKEIRRFEIGQNISEFQQFKKKLETIFPIIKGKRFTISWKDCDGEDIVFSSDEEFQIALSEMQEALIRKFYLLLHSDELIQNTDSEQQDSTTTVIIKVEDYYHGNIKCDECQESVFGFRYKCLQCANFVMCIKCVAKRLHPKHCLMRIPVPNLTACADYEQQVPEVPVRKNEIIHDEYICNECDKHICGFRYKCLECDDFDLCINCEVQFRHSEHRMLRLTNPVKKWPPKQIRCPVVSRKSKS